MSNKHVKIQTETLERISDEDFNILQESSDDFKVLAKKWGSFYVTMFLNENNRKVIFKFAYGKLIAAEIEKLDEDGE